MKAEKKVAATKKKAAKELKELSVHFGELMTDKADSLVVDDTSASSDYVQPGQRAAAAAAQHGAAPLAASYPLSRALFIPALACAILSPKVGTAGAGFDGGLLAGTCGIGLPGGNGAALRGGPLPATDCAEFFSEFSAALFPAAPPPAITLATPAVTAAVLAWL